MTDLLLLASSNPISHVTDTPVVQVGGFSLLSRHILMQLTAAGLLIWLIPKAVRQMHEGELDAPSGGLNALEAICQYFRDGVARPALGEHTDRFVPYIWSAFFYVLFCNLLGLVPFDAISQAIFGATYYGGTATGNVYTTATLSVCTLIMIVVNGLRLQGTTYLAHFCPGPLWLAPLLVPVELIGLVAKIFALTVRLFANMLAGHILLAVLLSFIGTGVGMIAAGPGWAAVGIVTMVFSWAGSVAINFLEIFVAFLQAFIFTFLTALFIGQAVNIEHHGEEHEEGEHAHAH